MGFTLNLAVCRAEDDTIDYHSSGLQSVNEVGMQSTDFADYGNPFC